MIHTHLNVGLGGHGQARRLPVTRCRKAESRLLGGLAP